MYPLQLTHAESSPANRSNSSLTKVIGNPEDTFWTWDDFPWIPAVIVGFSMVVFLSLSFYSHHQRVRRKQEMLMDYLSTLLYSDAWTRGRSVSIMCNTNSISLSELGRSFKIKFKDSKKADPNSADFLREKYLKDLLTFSSNNKIRRKCLKRFISAPTEHRFRRIAGHLVTSNKVIRGLGRGGLYAVARNMSMPNCFESCDYNNMPMTLADARSSIAEGVLLGPRRKLDRSGDKSLRVQTSATSLEPCLSHGGESSTTNLYQMNRSNENISRLDQMNRSGFCLNFSDENPSYLNPMSQSRPCISQDNLTYIDHRNQPRICLSISDENFTSQTLPTLPQSNHLAQLHAKRAKGGAVTKNDRQSPQNQEPQPITRAQSYLQQNQEPQHTSGAQGYQQSQILRSPRALERSRDLDTRGSSESTQATLLNRSPLPSDDFISSSSALSEHAETLLRNSPLFVVNLGDSVVSHDNQFQGDIKANHRPQEEDNAGPSWTAAASSWREPIQRKCKSLCQTNLTETFLHRIQSANSVSCVSNGQTSFLPFQPNISSKLHTEKLDDTSLYSEDNASQTLRRPHTQSLDETGKAMYSLCAELPLNGQSVAYGNRNAGSTSKSSSRSPVREFYGPLLIGESQYPLSIQNKRESSTDSGLPVVFCDQLPALAEKARIMTSPGNIFIHGRPPKLGTARNFRTTDNDAPTIKPKSKRYLNKTRSTQSTRALISTSGTPPYTFCSLDTDPPLQTFCSLQENPSVIINSSCHNNPVTGNREIFLRSNEPYSGGDQSWQVLDSRKSPTRRSAVFWQSARSATWNDASIGTIPGELSHWHSEAAVLPVESSGPQRGPSPTDVEHISNVYRLPRFQVRSGMNQHRKLPG